MEAPTPYAVGQEHLAIRALEQTQRQLQAGAEVAGAKGGPVTLGMFVESRFFPLRRKTVADWKSDERRLAHVLAYRDENGVRLSDMPVRDVRVRHLQAAFLAFREKLKPDGKPYAPKSIWNAYGVVQALFRDARRHELIFEDPCALDERDLGPNVDADPEWREGAVFEREELELLISSPLIPADRHVWYALEGLAAMRLGEAAAFRWRHWMAQLEPLGGILVAKSHGKEHTKTKRVRKMPVHPVLARMLTEWRLSGWPRMMGRHPGPDDLVIPCSAPGAGKGYRLPLGAMRTEKYVSSRTMRDLAALGLRHRRGHDLRATTITCAIIDGANESHLQACTHTPKKKAAFDLYNRIPWAAKCEAVAKLQVRGVAPARGELVRLAIGAEPQDFTEEQSRQSVTHSLTGGLTMQTHNRNDLEAAGIEPVSSGTVEGGRKRSKAVGAKAYAELSSKGALAAAVEAGRRAKPGNGETDLLRAALRLLERNGGPIDAEGTADGNPYVMVRREDFDALAALIAKLTGGAQ